MGLIPDETKLKSVFSDNILRLEITNPKEDYLSVIDIPDIFKRITSEITIKSDIEMMERIVYGYMKNPRSVMLTVISANVNIVIQEILEKAEEADPEDIRTLEILTKPDLIDKGAEKNVINLVEGRKYQLKLD